jgi:hypothetical protein
MKYLKYTKITIFLYLYLYIFIHYTSYFKVMDLMETESIRLRPEGTEGKGR